MTINRLTAYFTADPITTPAQRWRSRFHRQHSPRVRFWDDNWNLLHSEPVTVESWPAWAKRQVRRLRRNRYVTVPLVAVDGEVHGLTESGVWHLGTIEDDQ